MTKVLFKKILTAVLLAVSFLPLSTLAGGTKLWELSGVTEFDKGELKNTALSSTGEVTLGTLAKQVDLKETGIVWSAKRDTGNHVYLGTAYDGRIYRVDNVNAVEIATTGQMVITALAVDNKGNLYASSLPDAIIWKIPSPSKIKKGKPVKALKWATLSNDKGEKMHVWSLAFGRNGKTLFAGTGPNGKIYAVGADAKSDVYFDSEEEHILTLVSTDKGHLLAGTSPNAQLIKISGPGRATTLADFDATEVKVIVTNGDDIYAAVNKFKKPPAIPTKSKIEISNVGKKHVSKLAKEPRLGDGAIYILNAAAQREKLWHKKKNHVLSLAVAPNGLLYAGLASGGRVISVDKNRKTKTELDLDERQVMAIIADKKLIFAATGDIGAAYNLVDARPVEAFYMSPPLAAGAVSQWGRLRWFATGKLIVQTRSGNTSVPDKSWTDWSVALKNNSDVTSAPADYLQVRFSWKKDPRAVLRSVELAYLPQNRRAVITSFDPDSPYPASKLQTDKTKSTKTPVSTRFINAMPEGEHETSLQLKWKVDNPDNDKLRYYLRYRALGEKLWRPILKKDQILTVTHYNWKTVSVPQGRYQIKLTVDDSLSNNPAGTLKDELISVPVLVDNHQPRVAKLTYKKGRITGEAADSFSSISALEFSVDAGPWMPFICKDKIFDERTEKFDLKLPSDLSKGPHAIAVKTYDRTGNVGIAEIHIEVE